MIDNDIDRLSQQCKDLLEYMRVHDSITSREAQDELGIWRLAARICDLKKAGHHFEYEWVTFTARNGRTGRIKRYKKVA